MVKGKKITGGKYKKQRKKKLYERPGQKKIVKLGKEKRKSKRINGGNKKIFLHSDEKINVVENGKTKKLKIENVLRTPSNRFLARQKILTKGTIVKTKKGEVEITNRPTQEGIINGKLIA